VTTTYGYAYDLAGRLAQVSVNGAVARSYAYDANGNRLSVTDAATGTTSGVYDAQDRLLSYGAATYTYSAAGDLTSKTDPSGTTTYAYDALGNLIQVDLPDGRVVTYVIDGQNRRVGKRVNGSLVQGFLYQDQLEPVAELDGSGAVVARFVYGSRPNVPDYVVKGGATYRILSDHLGSPRLVVDASTGAVAQRIDYDEFGRVTLDTSPGFQPFGFAGGIDDRDAGLVRFGARDYDAASGRWTAKDPLRFGSDDSNLLAYAYGDPINFLDPTGEFGFAGAGLGFVSNLALQLALNGGQVACVDLADLAISTAAGALFPGLAQSASKAFKSGKIAFKAYGRLQKAKAGTRYARRLGRKVSQAGRDAARAVSAQASVQAGGYALKRAFDVPAGATVGDVLQALGFDSKCCGDN
jgi:RHS repeat-associated protein